MRRFALLFAGIVLCVASGIGCASHAGPLVRITDGTLAGTSDGIVETFKDIPYAAAPVGPLRWEPPAPPVPWTDTRGASEFGPICPQPSRPDRVRAAGVGGKQSEDCLRLNIWTFKGASHAPVMVWIHGGAFRFGSGNGRFYDGNAFAKDGVILVTLNYRLGALGFFAHPALTRAAAPDAPLGNYGLMDQIAALRWVRANIAVFGGDPDNVTIFGESAGGESVLAMLTTMRAKGLFEKAIVESGGGWQQKKTLADEEQKGAALATRLGLPGKTATLAQLRALTPQQLFSVPMRLGGSGPFIDGRLLHRSIPESFASGNVLDVPLMIGSNSYEASLMKIFRIPPRAILARAPASVTALYTGTDTQKAQDIFTDSVMGAPARWIAAKASGGAPTYLYHFSYVSSLRQGRVPGVQHGGEIPFVFGRFPTVLRWFTSSEDRKVETVVHHCWVTFAKTGKPACGGVTWPAYNPASDQQMEFGTTAHIISGFHAAQYGALEKAFLPKLLGAE